MYQRTGIKLEFAGGPFDGGKHNGCYRQIFTSRIQKGRWVAYVVCSDGRAEFTGWATSNAKARLTARNWESREEARYEEERDAKRKENMQ